MSSTSEIELLGQNAVDASFRLMHLMELVSQMAGQSGPSWPEALTHYAWEAAEAVGAFRTAVADHLTPSPSP